MRPQRTKHSVTRGRENTSSPSASVVAVASIRSGDEDLLPIPRELARRMMDITWLLPDPAGPVKNVEWPDRTNATTRHYSVLRVRRSSGGRVTRMVGQWEADAVENVMVGGGRLSAALCS